MAVTTKGTWAEGVFGSGSIKHFTVASVTNNFTGDNLELLLKVVQSYATVIIVGDASGATLHIAVENNGIEAATLQTAVRALAETDFDSATVVDFAY